MKLKYRYFCA